MRSEPSGATVFAGETILGVTPLDTQALAPGTTHALRFERQGYRLYALELETPSFGEEEATVRLVPVSKKARRTTRRARAEPEKTTAGASVDAPRSGYLTVRTNPWSEVRLDGKPMGSTPIFKLEVGVGRAGDGGGLASRPTILEKDDVRRVVIASLLGWLGACAPDAGQVRVAFEWPEGHPRDLPDSAHAFVRVWQQSDSRLLVDAPARPFERPLEIDVPPIPPGEGRVLSFEVRETAAPDAFVRYYGRSAPFDLAVGDELDLEVQVPLRATPSAPSIVLVGAPNGFVRTSTATLRIESSEADVEAEVSSRAFADAASSTRVPLGEDAVVDIEAGLEPCGDAQVCARTIFARTVDVNGYPSALATHPITLDLEPPHLVPAATSVQPTTARAEGRILVSVTADELLTDAAVLVPGRPAAVFRRLAPEGEPPEPATTFTLQLDRAAALQDAGPHALDVVLTDRAGNRTKVSGFAEVGVDDEVPSILDLSVSPEVLGPEDDTVVLAWSLSEDVDPSGVHASVGPLPDGTSVPFERCEASGRNWSCEIASTSLAQPGVSAVVAVRVEVVDGAGNTAVEGRALVLDFEPPIALGASVGYLPGPGNPIATLSAAGVGSTVSVVVQASEPVDAASARLLVDLPGGVQRVSPSRASESALQFEWLVPEGVADGTFGLRIDWQDQLTNHAVASLEPTVDLLASRPNLAVDEAGVEHWRVPAGLQSGLVVAGQTLPAGPSFWLRAPGGGAVSASTIGTLDGRPLAELRALTSSVGGGLVGRWSAPSVGDWGVLGLTPVDAARVYLVGVDVAGNQSAPVEVEKHRLVLTPMATPGVPAVHEVFACSEFPVAPDERVRVGEARRNVANTAAVIGRDGIPEMQATSFSFRPMNLGVRGGAAVDTRRGEFVSIQGADVYGIGRQGAYLRSAGSVPPNGGHWALGYHPGIDRIVMTGGEEPRVGLISQWTAGVWLFDGDVWMSGPPMPAARIDHQMHYDPYSAALVVSGGYYAGTELWAFDGRSWEILVADPSIDVVGAFQDRLIGVGGQPRQTYYLEDGDWVVWGLSGSTPDVVEGAFDPVADAMVAMGSGGTWRFDGLAWTQLSMLSSQVRPVYDPGSSSIVTADGRYRWNGQRWIGGASEASTAGLTAAGAYHEAEGFLVALADCNPDCGMLGLSQGAWFDTSPPVGLIPRLVAYDSLRERIAAVDAATGNLLHYDGSGWTVYRNAAGPPDVSSSDTFLLYDSARDQYIAGSRVLVGGREWYEVRLQVLGGSGWTPLATAQLVNHGGFAVADHRGLGELIMHGGAYYGAVLGDIRAFDGVGWSSVTGTPVQRYDHGLVYDPFQDRIVLFGGRVDPGLPCPGDVGASLSRTCRDLRQWSELGWQGGLIPDNAPMVDSKSAFYDTLRQSYRPSPDYELALGPMHRPAVQGVFDVQSAAQVGLERLESIKVRAWAAGKGGDGQPDGVTLFTWFGDAVSGQSVHAAGWQEGTSNGEAPGAGPAYLVGPNAEVEWTSTSSVVAQAVLQQGRLTFQVRTRGGRGRAAIDDAAVVAFDSAAVEIEYRTEP